MTNTIYLLVFLLSLSLSSCGSGEHSNTADTGSASFGLSFEQASAPSTMQLAPSAAPTDICSSYGIDSISGTVYNSSNTVIATGGPWACSAHTGTIYNIPPGSNVRIAIKGTVSGAVVWQGETTGATIYAGQDTNVGSIPMTYTGSDTTRPTITAATPTGTNVALTSPITVTFSEAIASSTIDSTTFTLKNGAVAVSGSVSYNATTKTATFTPTSSLSNSTTYTATVTTDVTDMAANQMQSIYTWDFTTEAPPGSAPSAPTGVTATAGVGQVTISWTAVTGATSYNIYWSTTTGVTTTNGTKVTGATSPYIHTARTNGTTYYYIVTAANLAGESTASSQVSATPSALMGGSIQGTSLNLTSTNATVTTFAGSAGLTGSTNGTGTAARFSYPYGMTTDGTNLFIADSYNHTIRKIVISTGAATTLAGSAGISGSTDATGSTARFSSPEGITTDGINLFIADSYNHTIRKIVISTGAVTTLAGSAGISGSTDATGSTARFSSPEGITTDGINLFVADYGNHTIRKIVISTGVVTTLAGSAGVSGSADGAGSTARFFRPFGITTDGNNLYIADRDNYTIRKLVISTAEVTTIAGSAGLSGSTDGTGTAARFYAPIGITTDGVNLFVADYGNHTIRKIVISTGAVTSIAGSAGLSGSTDGTGTAARFYAPIGITTDGVNLFVADTNNHTIRKIQPTTLMGGAVQGAPLNLTNTVTTFAGSAGVAGSTDGTGTAARFDTPEGVTTDGTNLYVTDFRNHTIRKIVLSTGAITTIAGSAGLFGSSDGTGSAARFIYPAAITTDGTNLFIADSHNHTIRRIAISTGVVTTVAGSAGLIGSTDGTGSEARFYYPSGITTDGTNLFVADAHNSIIRKIVIFTGTVTTLAGSAGISGSSDGTGTEARFNYLRGITTDGTNLFVADTNNHTIRKIVISTGVVTTISGSAGLIGATDGTGSAALFNYPWGITSDGANLFITDTYNHTIRKIVISTGAVTTIAGSAGAPGATDGAGSTAKFNLPWGITTDGTNLFLADQGNHTIRKIQ